MEEGEGAQIVGGERLRGWETPAQQMENRIKDS